MAGKDYTRRDFLTDGSKAALGAMIVPRFILGGPGFLAPSAKLNVAIVGVGGMGMSNMTEFLDENIVAVCDVDYGYVERQLAGRMRPQQGATGPSPAAVRLQEAYTKAKKYTDYRKMLEKEKGIDAVVIATPDHTHAVIAVAAMKAGKHVYVQKPLTYSVYEARLLARTARETKRVSQMGNQGHSMEGTRRIVELIGAGVIGPVREVHVWTDRPQRYWAQGIPRPGQDVAQRAAQLAAAQQAAAQQGTTPPATVPAAPTRVRGGWNMRMVDNAVLKAMAEEPQTPPEGLDWDLFLGPAPNMPYHSAYHPFSWRGWIDFGTSALGDMGAHLIDQPYWALGLGQPTSVSASSTPWGGLPNAPASYPLATTVEYEFAARGSQPAVKLRWFDGGLLPPRPPFFPDDAPFPRGDGSGGIFIGEKGILIYETYGNNPRVYPESLAAEVAAVPRTVPRIAVSHEKNFAQACKGEATASAPFEYSSALTETMLLGIVALRAGEGRRILYDAPGMKVLNVPEANAFLTREYRPGWAI
jgi:predicted dehydrogenase